ncbi:Aldo/keto reductase [Tilletiaria anomala UBC 951]|uniref:Aldo/keto reductase n=1 Tax=Tilletiaria anomala (strain ATCC 24038 / CBS 436.72 / UBC 951) TaxID=1037660 RepID=A0A066W9G8_TILAU|nr:Aldo/keto reductase [Tilletiaria anomala UBC 951]KDN49203.1 Aldo/keto reductase [Tilletiaria anomala UBC 951]
MVDICALSFVADAARYANEEAVGRAIKDFTSKSGVPREDIFVTSKLWDADHERAAEAIDESLRKLQLDYMDLYLVHSPGNLGTEARLKAWKDMEAAVDAGKIRSIGVSNFDVDELDHLLANCRIKPAVNQIESHPFFQHEELREATIARGIHVQAYSPMAQGAALERPEIVAIAKKHDKSSAQVLLKWGMNVGNIILPKSLTKCRIVANADLFDFELDQDDMDLLNSLDEGMKMGKLGPAGTSAPGSRRGSQAGSRRGSQNNGFSGGKLAMSTS